MSNKEVKPRNKPKRRSSKKSEQRNWKERAGAGLAAAITAAGLGYGVSSVPQSTPAPACVQVTGPITEIAHLS